MGPGGSDPELEGTLAGPGEPDEEEARPVLLSDRVTAGRLLAKKLLRYKNEDPVVLALPRGGLPVAAPIASELGAPLDIVVARKIGHPDNPELAIGAVSARGTLVLNERLLAVVRIPRETIDRLAAEQRRVAENREANLRSNRPMVPIEGRTAILVDDGVATGTTLRAAIADVREQHPRRLVVAAPVIAPDTLVELRKLADDVVYLSAPYGFQAISQFYMSFPQVSDEEAKAILRQFAPRVTGGRGPR